MNTHTRPKKSRWMLELLKNLTLLCVIVFGAHLWQTRDLLEPAQALPELKLMTLGGESQALMEKGKPKLIYVFAPWCGVCKLSVSNAQALKDADSQNEINVVLLAQDYASYQEVAAFLETHELSIPVLMGNAQSKQLLKIAAYPTYYLVDKDGKIVFRSVGYSTEWGMRVRSWLAQG